jgi:hypothetical protein
MNGTGWLGRISLAVEQMCEAEVAPAVKAQMLRESAARSRGTDRRRGATPGHRRTHCTATDEHRPPDAHDR